MAKRNKYTRIEIPAAAYKKLFALVQWEITIPKDVDLSDSTYDQLQNLRVEYWDLAKAPGWPMYANIHRGVLYVEADIEFDSSDEGKLQCFKVFPKQRKK